MSRSQTNWESGYAQLCVIRACPLLFNDLLQILPVRKLREADHVSFPLDPPEKHRYNMIAWLFVPMQIHCFANVLQTVDHIDGCVDGAQH